MTQYLRMYGLLAAGLVAVAAVVYVVLIVSLGVRSNSFESFKARVGRTTIIAFASVWFLFSAMITLLPTQLSSSNSVELLPLQGIVNMLSNVTTTTLLQLIGNFLLLGWLGFLVYPLVKPNGSLKSLALISLGVSLTIETIQFFVGTGRASSTDDVLLNVGGSCFLYFLAKKTWAKTPSMVRISQVEPVPGS